MFNHIGELPKHQYVWVRDSFVLKEPTGAMIPAIWFSLASTPGRAWGCTVMLESGAIYRGLPPHAIAFSTDPGEWAIEQAQRWDCYGWKFTAIEYTFLRGMDLAVKICGGEVNGSYLFTAAPVDDGFSDNPSQAKEFTFIRTYCDNLTIQPTDKVLVIDKSFCFKPPTWPTGIVRSDTVFSCE